MNSKIEHMGVIKVIYPNRLLIQIEQVSACADCHAKSVCSIAGKADKIIEIPIEQKGFEINEQVVIEGKSSMGLLAVWYAFVLPLILMFMALFFVKEYNSELYMIFVTLGVLSIYYMVLFICKKKLEHKFIFQVRKYIDQGS